MNILSNNNIKIECQNFRVFLNEPFKNRDIELKIVDIDQLIIPYRELSESLVKKLKVSIQEIGFIDPIDVVLKDKAHQAFSIFNEYLQNNPNLKEYVLDKKIEEAYYITLGIIIDKYQDEKFPGYAFEKILKKVDYFLDLELKDAIIEREKRANILIQAKNILNQKYEQLGISNSLVKQTIISKAFQNLYGRNVRNISDDFYTLFDKLIKEIPKVNITKYLI